MVEQIRHGEAKSIIDLLPIHPPPVLTRRGRAEECVSVKRDLFISQKRPIYLAKETYLSRKRGHREAKSIIHPLSIHSLPALARRRRSEVCVSVKRDLLYFKKRPIL